MRRPLLLRLPSGNLPDPCLLPGGNLVSSTTTSEILVARYKPIPNDFRRMDGGLVRGRTTHLISLLPHSTRAPDNTVELAGLPHAAAARLPRSRSADPSCGPRARPSTSRTTRPTNIRPPTARRRYFLVEMRTSCRTAPTWSDFDPLLTYDSRRVYYIPPKTTPPPHVNGNGPPGRVAATPGGWGEGGAISPRLLRRRIESAGYRATWRRGQLHVSGGGGRRRAP